ncbi:MAG: hypothetical protein H7124_17325 [Phycisphaerales bacterium]|nr:hypothetical protein [Hyphomonadaceae bacterium]
MQKVQRDPYTTERNPKSKGGPMLRYVILAGLLVALGLGYATMRNGPGLTDEPVAEQGATLTDGG